MQTLDYQFSVGLAVIGSKFNGYTVKEAVVEMLQNLQYVPGHTEVSMENIAKIV